MRDAYSAISVARRVLPTPGPSKSMTIEPWPVRARSMTARIALPSDSRPSLLVEHLARITQTGDMDPCLLELFVAPRQAVRRPTCFVLLALACHSPHQIEHMEFDRGMTQQMSEVAESPGVL